MWNSPQLPVVALIVAAVLAVAAAVSALSGQEGLPEALSEIEIGMVGVAFTLVIYALQGLLSVLLEGRALEPGRVRPRLTNPLSAAIVVFALILFAVAIALAVGIMGEWGPLALGVLAGIGCLDLALLLVFYKEAFLGDEACFDERDDGIPW